MDASFLYSLYILLVFIISTLVVISCVLNMFSINYLEFNMLVMGLIFS